VRRGLACESPHAHTVAEGGAALDLAEELDEVLELGACRWVHVVGRIAEGRLRGIGGPDVARDVVHRKPERPGLGLGALGETPLELHEALDDPLEQLRLQPRDYLDDAIHAARSCRSSSVIPVWFPGGIARV
jgi:hypothetical protein